MFEVPFQQARVAFSPPAGRAFTLAAEGDVDFRLTLLGPTHVEVASAISRGNASAQSATLEKLGPLGPGTYTIVVEPVSEELPAEVEVSARFA